ncbi:MAG: GrpB family protein [Puniceicoccales bacterium]|jgi:GrpB-like predicted nucleotidyltransferase (UPF0157 family)|nr:GrpB family protein [Puniceicoccales bacterium]
MAEIEVIPYDPRWPEMFEFAKKAIENSLGDNLIEIHHIGSTSVPKLAAKPKIDIIAVANSRNRAIADLEKIGYMCKGEWNVPLKCGFTKKENIGVNLHLFFESNHPEIELNLMFRDYLRTHPDVRNEYAAVKRQILKDKRSHEKINGFPLYTIKKREFIDSVIRTMGYNRLRILKCITEKEGNFIKDFQSDHGYFILYKGADIIGYTSVFNGEICECHAPDGESFEYLLSTMEKWIGINFSCS